MKTIIKRYEMIFEKSTEISEEQENKMLKWLKENVHLDEGDHYDSYQWGVAYEKVVGDVELYAPENSITVILNGKEASAELVDYFVEM